MKKSLNSLQNDVHDKIKRKFFSQNFNIFNFYKNLKICLRGGSWVRSIMVRLCRQKYTKKTKKARNECTCTQKYINNRKYMKTQYSEEEDTGTFLSLKDHH